MVPEAGRRGMAVSVVCVCGGAGGGCGGSGAAVCWMPGAGPGEAWALKSPFPVSRGVELGGGSVAGRTSMRLLHLFCKNVLALFGPLLLHEYFFF